MTGGSLWTDPGNVALAHVVGEALALGWIAATALILAGTFIHAIATRDRSNHHRR